MNKWIFNLFLFAASASLASAATVTIKPVFSASGPMFEALTNNRFAVFTTPGDTSKVTHLVINELERVKANKGTWYTANYEGIAASAPDSPLETGVAAFDLSAVPALPSGYISAGIVAVIPRAGSWASINTTTVDTLLANASGTAEVSDNSITLTLSNPSLTGSIGYAVDESNRIRLAPFTLSDGTTSYQFSNGWLDLTGDDSCSGLITSSDATGINSLDYVISISGLPDADNDGNPDMIDNTIWYGPYSIVDGGYVTSKWFGSFWLTGNNRIYHHQLRWLYCVAQDDWLCAYTYNSLGWIGTSAKTYPFIYLYGMLSLDGKTKESGWAYISQDDINALWIYFYSGSRANSWLQF